MNEDTEWNDILRTHGILPREVDEIVEDTVTGEEEGLEGGDLDSEWEDLEEDSVVQGYMQRRREEIKAYVERAKYGEIMPIRREEWRVEVTEASKKVPVLVFLYKDALLASNLLSEVLLALAKEYPYIKVVKIQGDKAIEGYPDKNLPTLLVYDKEDLSGQKTSISADITIESRELEEWFMGLGILKCNEVNQCRYLRTKKNLETI
ncbi:hypothetical protein PORY_000727 [Pneumocystis oryctolagi]|uniref:Uncharacterized protein n=1 Tax=Pneumocystis oryctolagi TaxID=42067 RepID=A0ACB7CGP0_9ASCO|nr:hypothetical protein PORY_000727 [Pneumocystis oryctolagi]